MAKHNIQMTADKREGSGKGTARAVRRTNRIPAVIYGDNKAPVLISIEDKPITLEHNKGHLFTALCDLNVAGEKHLVITRDLQIDPVTDRILHADFLRVTTKTVVRVEVPVHFIGQDACPGIKEGGTLTIMHHEIALMCPANSIPEEITVDLTGQPVNHSFKLSEIKLPNGVKPVTHDENFTIATIAPPRTEAEMAADAAADAPIAADVPASAQLSAEEVAKADAAKKAEKDKK